MILLQFIDLLRRSTLSRHMTISYRTDILFWYRIYNAQTLTFRYHSICPIQLSECPNKIEPLPNLSNQKCILAKNEQESNWLKATHQNRVKWTCLQTTRGLDCVSMHRISNPCDNLASIADSTDEMRQLHSHVLRPHSCNYGYPSRLVCRVQNINQFHQVTGVHFVAHLHSTKWQNACQFDNQHHKTSSTIPRIHLTNTKMDL